jgi:hypothetical protein
MLNRLTKKIFPQKTDYRLNLEIINEKDINHNTRLNSIITEFFNQNQIKLLAEKHLKIIIPEDFNSTYYDYSNSTIQNYINENGFPEHHGIFIPPSDKDATDYVLIIKEFVLSDIYEAYKTLYHEFTHFIDYTNYFNKNGNIYIADNDKKIENFYFEFYIWTEFNAKRIGLTRLKEELDKIGGTIDLAQTAINFQNDIVKSPSELESYYGLSHFLARIAVFESLGLSSIEFPSNWLSILFETDILKLYNKLKTIRTFKDFDKNKELLRIMFNLKKQKNYLC